MKFISCSAYSSSRIKLCVLSGLTVALALVPEAIAFAFAAACIRWWPLRCLHRRPNHCGVRRPPQHDFGATGALAVVMVAGGDPRRQYLFTTVVLMGLLQIAFGLLKLKFIRMVPFPVMIGFVNGSPS
jgi:SulP family sulfate permease